MTPSDPPVLVGGGVQRLHVFTLLFATVSVARRFLVPAIIGGVSAGDEFGEVVRWALLFLAVPAAAIAAARYFSFRYRIDGEELRIDSGIVSRKHRVIPLARVQNIELRQSIFHSLAGVTELRVETAGGGETEAVLSVVDREVGAELRELLLARRRPAEPPSAEAGGGELLAEARAPVATLLAHLTPRDLVIAGATANQAGLIGAVLIGALQFIDDLPFEIELPTAVVDAGTRLTELGVVGLVLFALALAFLLLVLGWIVSIVGSVIGYHDFTLEQRDGELRKRYGILQRREGNLPLERVQAVRIEETLLRRPLGLAAIKIESAGGGPGAQRGGAEAFLPLARAADIDRLIAGVFPDLAYRSLVLSPVHPRAKRRLVVRYLLRLTILTALAALVAGIDALLLLLLAPPAVALALAQYRNRGYSLLPDFVVTRRGVLNRITWLIPIRKVQTVHLREDPFQRRLGLTTLVVDTAAGGRVASVVDVGRETGRDLGCLLSERVPTAVRMAERGSRRARRPAAAPIDGAPSPAANE